MPHAMPRSARRAALSGAVAVAGLTATACGGDVTAPTPVALELTATPARESIGVSDTVTVTLVARNTGSAPVTVHSANGCVTSLVVRVAPLRSTVTTNSTLGAQRGCLNLGDVTIVPGGSVTERALVNAQTALGAEIGTAGQPRRYLLVPVLNDGNGETLHAALTTPAVLVVR
jgi:hypothetical protein